jgi:nitrile hydratase
MNGIHDLGGMHGFGPVAIEADEPVFHAPWERRVFGMRLAVGLRLGRNIDAGRHRIEQLDPAAYLTLGYYGRWLATLETTLLEAGLLREGEIEARMAGLPLETARVVVPAPAARPGFLREVAAPPAFQAGDRVVTRNHQPAGHTRLPGYARRRRGVVARVHPACVFPDTHAHGLGEEPQYVYSVRFEGPELWGDAAEPGTSVHLDLFEPYLERAEP